MEIHDRCNTKICKAVCCTFLTFSYDRKLDDDYKYFLALRGIMTKEVYITKSFKRFLRTYLRVPVICKEFDAENCICKIYDTRPRWCATNPTKDSPFIEPSMCSVLHPDLNTVPDDKK
jgi:Fe-S-cluster containining protein